MIARFFIARPVLANVLAIVIVLIGAVCLFRLPVAQYPSITPPTVQVTTRYPGASARTLIDTVALPIEQQVNGVPGMLYMQSTSASDGSYTLTVTFAIGTDLDFAQVLVQNRVATALAALPAPVQAQGVTVQKRSTAILQIVTLSAADGRYDSLYMANYATIDLRDELSRLPGVGNVNIFGAGQYAMRIWLDPEALRIRALTPQDVVNAIQQQSQEVTAGQLGAPPSPPNQPFQITVNVEGRFNQAEEFEQIIVKTDSGALTRLRDVGRVELGAQTYGQVFMLNGRPSAGLAIFQTPEANALDVAGRVRAKMQELSARFPQGLSYAIPFDTTRFVSASIDEVYRTLIEAAALVLIVILVFLQDWRAMLVPATTVPVTIIGAFAAMAALGFTVNLSTLFAIVLAIGIVVDDAIVVVENASKYIEQGQPGPEAAGRAMDELFGPIIGITLVLVSVFLPASFLPGLTGQLYAQFALVIAATALISAVNAATLKPTQCALWLKAPVPPEQRNLFYRGFNRGYDGLERGYTRLIARLVGRSCIVVAAALVLIGIGAWGIARVPTGFLPIEDQGYVMIGVQLPDGASLQRTEAAVERVQRIAQAAPGVDNVIAISGISLLDNNATLANGAVLYVTLQDWSLRGPGTGKTLRDIYFGLSRQLDEVMEARAFVVVPPPIQGVGNASGFTMQVELRDGSFDLAQLQGLTRTIVADAATQSGLTRLNSSFRATVPQIRVRVDRAKAEQAQVDVGAVLQTLATYLGSTYVNQFNIFGRVFQLYVQAEGSQRTSVADLEALSVRSASGAMVPLGTLLQIEETVGASLIQLYNLYPAATIIGVPAPGFSSGQALDIMEQVAAHVLPRGAGFEWTAMAYQEKQVGSQMYFVFALAIVLVYLVLAGQYESWYAPLAVILAVPLALLGPVAALLALGIDNNLYTQIGLVLLIALAAKNAILIVEVARERRQHGHDILESAVEAARSRLRPILMTSFAFILGMLPLVVATGAGASARRSIGLTVSTGMLASTCLAVVLVPSFFVLLQRFEEWRQRKRAGGNTRPQPAQAGE